MMRKGVVFEMCKKNVLKNVKKDLLIKNKQTKQKALWAKNWLYNYELEFSCCIFGIVFSILCLSLYGNSKFNVWTSRTTSVGMRSQHVCFCQCYSIIRWCATKDMWLKYQHLEAFAERQDSIKKNIHSAHIHDQLVTTNPQNPGPPKISEHILSNANDDDGFAIVYNSPSLYYYYFVFPSKKKKKKSIRMEWDII
ncbi:hypothetical protein RFI_23034 [Reticulomyxa filosa]|uniref:Uncharacterized protein n=1 Tax=Reticulomyxa filosa TaxID=46433 RepID=X6MMM1_RETFI|nr:hypothetical protein RFI_23034 [Reticulomyxa filosa]|eukprot:ETO14330.1 hypothetical protein RFI_23034 [Reticulomyxa filosa]